MRINARLDEATEQQLEYLTQTTGQSVSHVVRESVAHYYVQVKGQRQPSRLLSLALSGQWRSGRTDTSTHTRSTVREALQAKYPQHFDSEPAPAVKAHAPARRATADKPMRRAG
jgi:hypothetical protein